MTAIFAVTTRGLESICAREMSQLPNLQVTGSSYRRVAAQYAGPLAALLSLRTVDDVFLSLGEWEGVPAQRSALEQIRAGSRALELEAAALALAELRPAGAPPSFSVTVNFVGQRNYSAEEVKQAVAREVGERWGWAYGAENETSQNLRVFIDHEHADLGLRVSSYPLHARPYKQAHISGSLKPSAAAAMVFLADAWPGALLLDPFCGAGTLPIEAALQGLRALGGDRAVLALAAAEENRRAAGVSADWLLADARRLPLASRSVDFVVSNFPWGRQVAVGEELSALYRAACAQIERVLAPGGRAVLLTSLPELARFERLQLQQRLDISLFGQNPQIGVYGR